MSKRSKRRSRSKRRKSRLGRPRDHNKHRPERGCSLQRTKKYRTRPSPPYPANLCRNSTKKGNNKKMYKSIRTKSKGKIYYRWAPVSRQGRRSKKFGVQQHIVGF